MVRGIDKFKEAFKNFNDLFIIIGGTACENIMSNAGLPFRATKDLDIVLIIEAINKDFFRIFWEFVKDAGYQNREKSDGKKQFFRFSHPTDNSFPFMIELFSRKLENISMPAKSILTPIPADESIASLSAILLDDDYYHFIISHRILIDNLPFVTVECLIPLKSKAWLDLSERKDRGEKIKSNDIKKHKNDIIRLSQLLPAGSSISLPPSLKKDMLLFIDLYESSDINPEDLNINMKKEDVFKRLRIYYQLI